MRQIMSTALVALIVGAVAGGTMGAMAQAEPAAQAITLAAARGNADRVDGKHAVNFTNARGRRAGKLVATNRGGWLPSNIVQPLWHLIKDKPASLADGQVSFGEIAGMPPGFADGVDNAGVSQIKVTRVVGPTRAIDAGEEGYTTATCPAGSVLVGGGAASSNSRVFLTTSSPSVLGGEVWNVWATNTDTESRNVAAFALCLSIEPSGRLSTASKGKVAPAVKRAWSR